MHPNRDDRSLLLSRFKPRWRADLGAPARSKVYNERWMVSTR
jgi:hypothetical protein